MNKHANVLAVLWRWRYAIGLAILSALVALGVRAVNRVADVERYRPEIVAALERATGMHASVGRMKVRFLPAPGIAVYDLSLDEGESSLLVRRATASMRLAGLAQRRIVIGAVTLSDVSLVLPKDLAALRDVGARFGKPDATSSSAMPNLDIDAFYIRRGVIRHGADGPILATFDGVANTVMADTIPVRITAKFPVWGADAHFLIEGTLSPRNGPGGQGRITLDQVDLAALANRPELAGARAGVTVVVNAPNLRRISAEISGAVSGAAHDALNGSLSATAWWQEDTLTVNGLKWASAGTSLDGELTWNPPMQLACRIASARTDAATLIALADLQRGSAFRLKPRKNASLAIQDVMIGVNDVGETRVAQGTAAVQGIDVVSGDGKRLLSNLHASIGVEDGVVRVRELAAEGLELTGTLRPDWRSRSVAIEAGGSATLAPAWLALVPASMPVKDLKGRCTIDKISATVSRGQGFPRDFAATGSLKDVSVTLDLPGFAQPLAIKKLKGGVGFKEGTIALDNVSAEGIAISGTLHPEEGGIAVDLHGKAALKQAPLDVFISRDFLSDWGGTLTVETFKATLGGKGLPADLELAAAIEDGCVALVAPGYVDTFSNATAHVTADPKAIEFNLEMRSAQAGAFSLHGEYAASTGAVNGALTADAAQCALPFLKSIEARQTWFPIIQGLGLSTFRVAAQWPPSKKDEVPVNISRDGEPPCNATFTLAKREGKWTLGEIEASVTVPLKLVQPLIPAAIEAEGDIVLRARRSADSPELALEADLTGVDAVIGDYLNKKRGDRLAVETVLETKTGGVDLNAIHVRYGKLDVPLRIQDGGAYVDNIDLDFGSLAGLLPKQGAAHGRVRGSFATKPLAATLELDGVGAFIAPDMGIDTISGKVTIRGTRVILQDMHAQGLDSDCTFNAELIDGVFRGHANGSRLNLNDVINFADHLTDYKRNPKPDDGPWHASPFACELEVTLDTLIYRKGAAQEVSGEFSVYEEVVRAAKLVAKPYSGRITGSIEVDPSRNKIPGRVVLNFETQDADIRFVDETVFDMPRGLAGTVTGKISMSILTGTDADSIEGTNGGFTLDAQNGSLGEVAFATQLRNILKTTTLVRLHLPEYGKDALDFDRFHANVVMKNGVWTIQEAEMNNPYLAMTGEGTIYFPQQTTDVRLRINFLESVTGLLGRVPLVGGAISKVGGMTGLDLQIYDSPYDMKARLRPTQRLENAGKKAGEVVDTLTKPFRRK